MDVLTASCLSFSFNADKISSIVVFGEGSVGPFHHLNGAFVLLYQSAAADLLGFGGGETPCRLSLSVTLNLPFWGNIWDQIVPIVGSNHRGQLHFCNSFLLQCKLFVTDYKTHANNVVSWFCFFLVFGINSQWAFFWWVTVINSRGAENDLVI